VPGKYLMCTILPTAKSNDLLACFIVHTIVIEVNEKNYSLRITTPTHCIILMHCADYWNLLCALFILFPFTVTYAYLLVERVLGNIYVLGVIVSLVFHL
jgi:hypothetical protein